MGMDFHSLLAHKEDERNVLDKRLEDNELALRKIYKEGVAFIDNIKLTIQHRLHERKTFENQCDEGQL